MSIVLKRIYDDEKQTGGYRILIDRVWPRGISKEKAQLDEWAKELTPTSSLRQWFNHDPDKFNEFESKYKKELHQSEEAKSKKKELQEIAQNHRVVLLYGAKNEKHNHAIVLKDWLENQD
ncbi:DUF488 domain-containing protein [Halobacillus sp. SY10]|uniref:Uncharacterized conserved protein YeaO, DUF488 family n=2 Tax=Halobacillus TaxID=45667 RepID=A0A1H0EDL5_HALAD|nr:MULTISPECIES: DUF488 family protein [Halobacillus]RDY71780.1 DUF488 family protein [Halobacillus trueperi]SDN80534.1 Uncharacterized conserved protein YeaO, DUF488 family [Halobacillus aidingensis]